MKRRFSRQRRQDARAQEGINLASLRPRVLALTSSFFQDQAQALQLAGLLEQHGQQDGLEGQGVVGLADGGRVLAGGGEEGVEGALVLAAQGAAKLGERGLLVENDLVGGGKCAANGNYELRITNYEI